MLLAELTPALMNQAVDIYLRHAYDDPEAAEPQRVVFDDHETPEQMLSRLEDETDPRSSAHRAYALRLGSQGYPHMKLSLWEAYYHDQFVFAVDTHDGFDFDTSSPGYQEWLEVKDQNRQRKQFIEKAWYEAGVPTLRGLKEKALSRTDCLREFRHQEVFVVDDDADSAAIIRTILEGRGFRCRWARTIREAREYVQSPDCACGLALVDVVMCDGNGVEVVRALRANPRTQDVPVVLTSALSGSEVQVPGISVYLRKPYSVEELVETIERTIQTEFDGHRVFLDSASEAAGGA